MPTLRHDTKAWTLQVWVSFGTAITLAGTGLAWLPGQELDRAFMVMGYLFTPSTAFALARTLREAHEAALAAARGQRHEPQ